MSRHSRAFLRLGLPLARLIVAPLLFLLGPVRVKGNDKQPRSGGLLILANHQSDLDPVVCQVASPRPIYFVGKSELFEIWWLAPILRAFKALSIRRDEPDREAIRQVVELLKDGNAVCIYPEGRLSQDGSLLPLKPGVALMARMSGATIQCLGLRGTNRIMPYGITVPRPALRKVEAVWGDPKTFTHEASKEEIMAWVEAELRRLME